MKKTIRLFSALSGILLAASILGGCDGQKTPADSSTGATAGATGGTRPLVSGVEDGKKAEFEKRELENPNVKFFLPYEPNDDIKGQIAEYEKKYGGKVEVITCSWDVRVTRLAQLIQSGDSPDVASVVYSDMPTFAIKGLLDPIDGLTDLDNEVYLKEINDSVYSLNGKHYALSTFSTPYAIFFNRSMFKKAAVTAPDELYKAGSWNWETFRQTALDMTEDSDSDGSNDIYGFATWRDDVFLVANGTDLIKMEDGYPLLNVTDSRVSQGLQLFEDMFYTDHSIQKEHWEWYEGFRDKKVAMVFEGADFQISRLVAEGFSDEIGIVPFPAGPGASEPVNYVANTGFGLVRDTKNPQGGAAFIEEYLTAAYKNITAGGSMKALNDEQFDMMKSLLDQKMAMPLTTGYGDFANKFFAITDELRAGKPVGTTLERYAPELQAEIDKVMNAGT